jgi:NAD-dependent SIR2 family protein deacetylase
VQGARVIQINSAATPLDSVCDFNLRGEAGAVLPAVLAAMQGQHQVSD